jgi:hypothetical protein
MLVLNRSRDDGSGTGSNASKSFRVQLSALNRFLIVPLAKAVFVNVVSGRAFDSWGFVLPQGGCNPGSVYGSCPSAKSPRSLRTAAKGHMGWNGASDRGARGGPGITAVSSRLHRVAALAPTGIRTFSARSLELQHPRSRVQIGGPQPLAGKQVTRLPFRSDGVSCAYDPWGGVVGVRVWYFMPR